MMVNAVYCNRCKELFPEDEISIVSLDIGYNEDFNGHLCGECKSTFENVWCGGGAEILGDEKDETKEKQKE